MVKRKCITGCLRTSTCITLILAICVLNSTTTSLAQDCYDLYDLNSHTIGNYPDGATVYVDVTALSSSHDPEYQSLAASAIGAAQDWQQVLGTHVNISFDPASPDGRTLIVKPGVNPDDPDVVAFVPYLSTNPDHVVMDTFGNLKKATVLINLNAQIHLSGGVSIRAVTPLTSSTIGRKVMRHEFGHVLGGLRESKNGGGSGCQGETPGATVMNQICGQNDGANGMPDSIQPCDTSVAIAQIQFNSPPPDNDLGGGCKSDGGGCVDCTTDDGTEWQNCYMMGGQWYSGPTCDCSDPSPLLFDIAGDGITVSNRADGIVWDIGGGRLRLIPFTLRDSDDAWLVWDRNHNGRIDGWQEMFGNFTAQSESDPFKRNGFLAAAELDKPENGGNGNGKVDADDALFTQLRLWQNKDHDGVAESWELHTLPELGVAAFDLKAKESKYTDANGNQYRYWSKVTPVKGFDVDRKVYDVYLTAPVPLMPVGVFVAPTLEQWRKAAF